MGFNLFAQIEARKLIKFSVRVCLNSEWSEFRQKHIVRDEI